MPKPNFRKTNKIFYLPIKDSQGKQTDLNVLFVLIINATSTQDKSAHVTVCLSQICNLNNTLHYGYFGLDLMDFWF